MNKKIALVLFLAITATLLTVRVAAQGQLSTVKGHCVDMNGNPIANALVTLENKDSARTIKLKTNRKGDYFTIGAFPGHYIITLFGTDGKELYHFKGVLITDQQENVIDFDMKKEAAAAGASPEALKKIEEAKKQNAKIEGLNAMLQEAFDDRKNGQFDAAIEVMKKATTDTPTIAVLWVSLADSYLGAKQYPDAITSYKKAIELAGATDPQYADYLNNLGTAYSKSGDNDSALKQFDAAAAANPTGAAQYYYNAGAVLTNGGQADAANALFDKAIAADPTKADAYFQKGVNLFGKATTDSKGTVVAPAGTAEALNKYLELAPTGTYADAAKQILQTIGAKFQTSVGTTHKGKR
jgi:tetratricopeptide (TPR) repeat protein